MTKSLGLRIYASGKPSLVGARVIPMSKEDASFWELHRERRAIAAADAAAPGPLMNRAAKGRLGPTGECPTIARRRS